MSVIQQVYLAEAGYSIYIKIQKCVVVAGKNLMELVTKH